MFFPNSEVNQTYQVPLGEQQQQRLRSNVSWSVLGFHVSGSAPGRAGTGFGSLPQNRDPSKDSGERGAHGAPGGACLSLTEPDTIDAVSVYSTKEPAAKHWQKSKVADYT